MVQVNKNFIKKLLGSKVFLFCISFVLIVLVINVGRESYRKYQLTKEINRLKLEIERLEGKNQQFSNLLEYFKEESYLEKEARLKLNLKKSGEKVVVLPQSKTVDNSASVEQRATDLQALSSKKEESNWWKWWEYFFEQ